MTSNNTQSTSTQSTSTQSTSTQSTSTQSTIPELDRKILEEDRKILAWIYDILGENLAEKIIDQ